MSQDSEAKRINLIKLDDAYYYGDVRMSQKEMAREAARVELLTQANSLRREEGLPSIGEADVEGIQYILTNTRRGDIRCFGYILRTDVGKPKAQAMTPAPDAIGGPAAAPAPAPAPAVAQTPAPAPASNDATVAEVTSGLKDMIDKANEGKTPEQQLEDTGNFLLGLMALSMYAGDAEAVSAPTRSEPVKIVAGKLVPWQVDAVEEIMEQPDFDAAMRLLDRFRSMRKISGFGAPNKCPSEKSSFWVMFDGDDQPVTVIGPDGAGGYTDLVSGDSADLRRYAGNTAVWFQFRR